MTHAERLQEVLIDEATPTAGDFIEFKGRRCVGECLGWDGRSKTCECGSQRVRWEFEPDGTYVYAEAAI